MLRSLRPVRRWLAGSTLPGWLALRLWVVLAVMVPALGMGGWARPAAAEPAPVDEPGLHAGPAAHGDPAERTHELPPTGETKDAKDAEDEFRERVSIASLWLAPRLDLDLAAAVSLHRFADAHDAGSGSLHGGSLHNRGPPVM